MPISIVDIIFIAALVLGVLVGVFQQSYKAMISFLALAVSFVGAFFLTAPIAGAFLRTETFGEILFQGLSPVLSNIIPEAYTLTQGMMYTMMSPITEAVNASQFVADGTVSASMASAMLVSRQIFSMLVFVGLLILLRVMMMFATHFAVKAWVMRGVQKPQKDNKESGNTVEQIFDTENTENSPKSELDDFLSGNSSVKNVDTLPEPSTPVKVLSRLGGVFIGAAHGFLVMIILFVIFSVAVPMADFVALQFDTSFLSPFYEALGGGFTPMMTSHNWTETLRRTLYAIYG